MFIVGLPVCIHFARSTYKKSVSIGRCQMKQKVLALQRICILTNCVYGYCFPAILTNKIRRFTFRFGQMIFFSVSFQLVTIKQSAVQSVDSILLFAVVRVTDSGTRKLWITHAQRDAFYFSQSSAVIGHSFVKKYKYSHRYTYSIFIGN